ncbi:hypothetical protein JHK87_029156 [Glycine soja]|nr:hypothetical protein JHK87_029156 [Glycine soja]
MVHELENDIKEAKIKSGKETPAEINSDQEREKLNALSLGSHAENYKQRMNHGATNVLDKVLVKHVSKLEKEKMRINSGEEWGPVKRSHRNIHSETNEARERELQEAWGGQGLGNSIKPRLSKLEREKNSQTAMGGGNGQKCKVCMQTFISEVKCREHAEAKHPKADLYTCFPHLHK